MQVQQLFLSYAAELTFVLFVLVIAANNNCPVEYSSGVKWQSNGAENELVISQPVCLNQSNELIARICINGTWLPRTTPICYSTLEHDEQCPDDFDYIDGYCVQVSNSQGPDNNLNGTRFFFLPIKRVVRYGPFEYTQMGENYGQTFPVPVKNFDQFYKNDCLVLDTNTNTILAENCSASYDYIRYFPKNFPTYSCSVGCVPANGIDRKCYCKRTSCLKMARFRSVEEKNILQSLAGDDMCRIEKNVFKELSQDLFVSKTLLQYRSGKTNCEICERHPLQVDTKLVLSFEEPERRLYLIVYYPEGIQRIKDKYAVFCFTNAANDKLKDNCDIEQVFQQSRDASCSILVYKVKLRNYVGEYWCEAFATALSPRLLKSNKVLAYRKKRGNEYALRLLIPNVCKTFTCDFSDFISNLLAVKLKNVLRPFNPEIRLMEIFQIDTFNDFLDLLLHVSTGRSEPPETEYLKCLARLDLLENMQVVYFKSSEFCLSGTTTRGGVILTWPLTKIGGVVPSNEFCLSGDLTPRTRLCGGSFLYGATWSGITATCAKNVTIPRLTQRLQELAASRNTSLQKIWSTISDHNFNILDIYYINVLLRNLEQNDNISLNIMDKLVRTDKSLLKQSQRVLNLTDITLKQIDHLLEKSIKAESVYLARRDNLLVHISNPFVTNISGLMLYNTSTELSSLRLVNFQRSDSFDVIDKHNLVLAVHVPEQTLEQILNETERKMSEIFVVTVIFSNDNLFVDDNYHSDDYVISVSIPSFGSYLQSPICVIFKSNGKNSECGFWNVGKNLNWKTGEWSLLGGSYEKIDGTSLHQCSFVHLTHFALLLMSDKVDIVDDNNIIVLNSDEPDDVGLEIITITGSILSLLGIVGILLTALLFARWRNKLGTKVLLNLSVAILLELICIQLSEIKQFRESEYACKIVGIILHYVVLSQFCWMLVYAILQYYRFVRVIGAIPNNLILKCAIFGWGVPLVLVFIVGLTTTQSYVSKSYELCYPRGILLYLTVIMPVCLIISANIIIFGLIMYNITCTKTSALGKKMFKLKLYLALLLFSVLGIPWLFGLLAVLVSISPIKIVLFYTFCITATMQGFVLFVFYVVLNKETRQLWICYFKSCNK